MKLYNEKPSLLHYTATKIYINHTKITYHMEKVQNVPENLTV